MSPTKTPRIGAVELPEVSLLDSSGRNYTYFNPDVTLISKQVLISNLQSAGFDVELINLKDGDHREELRTLRWNGLDLRDVLVGRDYRTLDPGAFDAWAVTCNFLQLREAACRVVAHLASEGRPVVVGGSDAIAESEPYLKAGAAAVVLDKSGAANASVLDHVLGRTPRSELGGVALPDRGPVGKRLRPLHPNDWPLPAPEVVKQCLGRNYWTSIFPRDRLPLGSVFTDIGCDRKCDFCQTPEYNLGYRTMTPETAFRWFEAQRQAGARTVIGSSDQFLGRILFKEGREEILEIMKGVRDLGLAIAWPNGQELRKATRGRGFNREGTDLTPDDELIESVFGWDGKVGCYHTYVPAERPVLGNTAYAKLLPWREHCDLIKAVVRSGTPAITYGVIIGFADDSHDSLSRLEEAVSSFYDELRTINPAVEFHVSPFALSPIPGTPQGYALRQSKLLRFEDPTLYGGMWTPSCDTNHLGYEQIAEWQRRLLNIGSAPGRSYLSYQPMLEQV